MATPQQQIARAAPFGYRCGACGKCCAHQMIQVNPFEIAFMARGLGLSTSAFRAAHTERGGTLLKRTSEDICIFHQEGRCSVHAWRPLVCRLYPLGRQSERDGTERWLAFEAHPDSRGQHRDEGTIADFITAQGALPFMQAADDYADWVIAAQQSIAAGTIRPFAGDDVLDMDTAISNHCARGAEPDDLEARRRLHLTILYRAIGGEPPDE